MEAVLLDYSLCSSRPFANANLLLLLDFSWGSPYTHANLGSQDVGPGTQVQSTAIGQRTTSNTDKAHQAGMQTCLHSNALALHLSRHPSCAGSTSLPLFRDRLHQKCTATPSTSGRTLTCSAAAATMQNYTATAVESKRGIKNNSTELIGDTPMVRGRPNEVRKRQQSACPNSCACSAQVYLNKVNERCFARIACKLELMEPCTRYPIFCPAGVTANPVCSN